MSDSHADILSLQYDPDDKFIAVGCGDGTIKVYNAFTAKLMAHMGAGAHHSDVMPYTCIRWKPSGTSESGQKSSNILVATTSDGQIQHWAMNSSKCLHTIKEEGDNNLYALDFSVDGKHFAVGGSDTHVYVYDEATKQQTLDMKVGGKNLPGHASRIFVVKFHPQDQNVLVSAGWDRTIQIYDLREGRTVGSIYGPHVSGDALDIYDDMIVAGSNRNKEVMQLFSLSKKQLVANIDWEGSGRKDLEAGYVFGTRFSKPEPSMIFAGGAGKNEVKVFENNCDGSASFRILASIQDLESPCLSIDVAKQGEHFAFGCQDGRIFICQYKLEEGLEFEGYQGGTLITLAKVHKSSQDYDEEERKEL